MKKAIILYKVSVLVTIDIKAWVLHTRMFDITNNKSIYKTSSLMSDFDHPLVIDVK